MHKTHRTSFLTGFKVVDYAIGFACLLLLALVLLPMTDRPRGPSMRSACLNNMRQIILACHNYQSANQKFPSASGATDQNVGPSFIVSLLPFLDEQNVASDYESGIRLNTLPDVLSQLSIHEIDLLACPVGDPQSSPSSSVNPPFSSHYFASLGPNSDPDGIGYQFSHAASNQANQAIGLSGVFSPWSTDPADPNIAAVFGHQYGKTFDEIRDGSSNTIALIESSKTTGQRVRQRGWAFGHSIDRNNSNIEFVYSGKSTVHPINSASDDIGWNDRPISSNHSRGAQVAMADGSARFVHDGVSVEILRAASSIDDGQPDDFE